MHVIGINASPRGTQSRTRVLVEAVLRGAAEGGATTEFVDIYALKIGYCTACGACYRTGECVQADDYPPLLDRMLDADGIVLGSPVYIDGVTAPLKALLDRMADIVHCQMFSGKYGCSVSTAGGSYADELVGYMNSVLRKFGATTVGGMGVVPGTDPGALAGAADDARKLGLDLAGAIRMKVHYPDQDAEAAARGRYMQDLVRMNKDQWTHEYEYWDARGWI